MIEYIKGRVLFLQDSDIKYYPKRIIHGDIIELPFEVKYYDNKISKYLPYLKFIECEMSKLHQQTYNKLEYVKRNLLNHELYVPRIPMDGLAINDMVFPNPDSTSLGLYRNINLVRKINRADDKWKKDIGINIVEKNGTRVITGTFLQKNNIKKYSTKDFNLLNDLDKISGKCFIYHNYVHGSGVLHYQELLEQNGYIDEYSDSSPNTKCYKCGVIKKDHKNSHNYYPARFVIVHSEGISKNMMNESIRKFNMVSNFDGRFYKIIIGSKIIKESYDLKAIQHLFVMSIPTNIPTLIQIFGTCYTSWIS